MIPIDRGANALIECVRRRGGFDRESDAVRALRVTLQVLGRHLDRRTARAIARSLPAACAGWLTDGDGPALPGLEALYRAVALREQVPMGFAIEHTQAVTAALLECLDPEGRRLLLSAIPEPLAERVAVERPTLPPRSPRYRAVGRTLASARPGSTRPLCEAAPGQRESVARARDPRGSAKLSASPGQLPGRSGSLSTGQPGSSRPLCEAED